MSVLWSPAGRRVRVLRRGHDAARRARRRLRELTDYVYFRDNVAGRPARVVAAPDGLRRVVPRRARHADERGARGDRSPSRGSPREARAARGERIDRSKAVSFTFAGWKVTGFEGDTIALGSVRRGEARLLALVQVPPAARSPLLLGPLPELPDDRRRRPERARLHRADPRGRRRRGAERPLVARLRLHVADGQARRPVHAGRLLLPHVHPPASRVAAVREVPARARPGSASSIRTRGTRGATTPSTAGRACSSSAGRGGPGRRARGRDRPGPGSSSSTRTRDSRTSTLAGVEVLAPARALGIWEGGLVPVDAGTILYRFRAERIVVATGATEQPLVFPGNDLVGVMLPDGVRRLIRDFSIRPGERAIVLGSDDETLAIADELADAGIEVAKVVDLRDARPRELAAQGGKGRVRRSCSTARATAATCSSRPAAGSRRTRCSPRRVRASSTTTRSASSCRPSFPTGSRPSGASPAKASRAIAPEPAYRGKGKCFVCVCEDVTTKDMKRAIEEGFDSIELAKRYTTTTMGPCQGKLCHLSSIRVYAEETRMFESAIGTTTARPPWAPVELGLLAGRELTPARRRLDPLAPRGGGRDDPVGRPLEAALRLRRASRGRGARGARVARRHRRLDAREAPRRGAGGRPAPRAPVPEPLRRHEARPDPLRRPHLGRRSDHGRRHDRAARRRPLLRDDDVDRRRCGDRVVRVVERGLGLRRGDRERDRRARRREPRRAACERSARSAS